MDSADSKQCGSEEDQRNEDLEIVAPPVGKSYSFLYYGCGPVVMNDFFGMNYSGCT